LEEDKKQNAAKAKEQIKKKKKSAKDKPQKGRIQLFFENLAAEFRKIIWPDRNELFKQTIVVIIISLFFGVLIFGMDTVFNYIQTLVTDLTS